MAGIIETQILKSAPGLIYVFIPNGFKVNARIAFKRKQQITTLTGMCKAAGKSFAWGQSIVRDGIKQQFNKPVETVLNEIFFKDSINKIAAIDPEENDYNADYDTDSKGKFNILKFVGLLGKIGLIIEALISLLIMLKILPPNFSLKNIFKIVPSESDVNGNLPDPNGISWNGGKTQTAGMDNTFLYVGGAVIAYSLWKSTQQGNSAKA